jgi:hypothetical protein
MESLLAKDLYYCGSKYPICSIIRTKKFIRRGWKMSAGQYLKMCLQISALDMADPRVVREQLTGVDIAYFSHIVQWIEDHPAEAAMPRYIENMIDALDDGGDFSE